MNSKQLLASINYAEGDDFNLPASKLQFADGGHFGIELSSINNMKTLQTALSFADQYGLKINRIDECRGLFRLPDAEVKDMVALCTERDIKPIFSTGPRAIYDTGAFVNSKNGVRLGYRLRGMDNIRYALDEVCRGLELGVNEFLIYDEGLLDIMGKLRNAGELPKTLKIKYSVHSGCANPASAKLYEELGADSINLIPDLELPMLSTIRQTVACNLDIFSDTAKDAGGLIRTPQMPEIVKLCSPTYLKCGPVSQNSQNHLPTENEIEERVKQAQCVLEAINRAEPELVQTNVN